MFSVFFELISFLFRSCLIACNAILVSQSMRSTALQLWSVSDCDFLPGRRSICQTSDELNMKTHYVDVFSPTCKLVIIKGEQPCFLVINWNSDVKSWLTNEKRAKKGCEIVLKYWLSETWFLRECIFKFLIFSVYLVVIFYICFLWLFNLKFPLHFLKLFRALLLKSGVSNFFSIFCIAFWIFLCVVSFYLGFKCTI